MDGISRSRGWDKEIPHSVLLMEQLVLSHKWARNALSMMIVMTEKHQKLLFYSSKTPFFGH